MARLSVAILGPPEVRHGQRSLTFPTRKALAVLIYLVVERGVHPREKLTALFWPDSDSDAGRATLRSTLARLREGLAETTDEPHLIVERDAVGFDFASDVELDLDHLATAAELARTLGSFLVRKGAGQMRYDSGVVNRRAAPGGPATMIRDRYDPVQLFELVPQLQLAFEPELAEIDRLLDDEALVRQVKADLAQRRPHSATTGRPATPVEVILRLLVVKHLYGWSYAETERFVGDSLVLRQFCRLGLERAPDDTTLLRWANLIQPATLHALLDRIMDLARAATVTRGRKLRTDTTVVETHIHYPTDNSLLADGVRVLGRALRRAKAVLPTPAAVARRLGRDRSRSAKRLARRIGAAGRDGGGTAARPGLYAKLVAVTQATLRQVAQVRQALAAVEGAAAARVRRDLERFTPLVARVVEQTVRRVRDGAAVPAAEKVVSLFAPHTAIITKGKTKPTTEFGAKVVLDEVDGGLVTRYEVLAGNPPDATCWPASLAHHQAHFGRAPALAAADRGFATSENEAVATAAGVKQVCLPRPGHQPAGRLTWERQPWFRRGRRFRAGIEGRISRLKRRFGWERCRDHGPDGLARAVGWGVIAHNLSVIGQTLARRRAA